MAKVRSEPDLESAENLIVNKFLLNVDESHFKIYMLNIIRSWGNKADIILLFMANVNELIEDDKVP